MVESYLNSSISILFRRKSRTTVGKIASLVHPFRVRIVIFKHRKTEQNIWHVYLTDTHLLLSSQRL